MPSTTLTTIIDGALALAIICAGTVLLALHDIDGTTGLAVIGVGVALVHGSTKTMLALKVPPKP